MYSSSLTLRWNEDRYMGVMLRYGVNAHPIFNASDFVHFLPSGPLDYHHHRWMNTLGKYLKMIDLMNFYVPYTQKLEIIDTLLSSTLIHYKN